MDLEQWILLQEDSHANQYKLRDSKKQQKTIANSGLKCLELSKKSDPPTSLEKMSAILLASEKEWYSNKCVLTWRVKATKCRRLYYLLQQSTHRTRDIDVGSSPHWSTPTVMDSANIQKPRKKNPSGGQKPLLCQQVKMWPTPTTQDGKNNGGKSQHRRNSKPLNAEVGGALNPQWVEWLMGYPIGWTDLKD